jgi:hypothetical protein
MPINLPTTTTIPSPRAWTNDLQRARQLLQSHFDRTALLLARSISPQSSQNQKITKPNMASTKAAGMARAVLVAVVLMQCCNVIAAARPLLEATTAVAGGGDGGWLELLMQVLQKGGNPGGWNGGHP